MVRPLARWVTSSLKRPAASVIVLVWVRASVKWSWFVETRTPGAGLPAASRTRPSMVQDLVLDGSAALVEFATPQMARRAANVVVAARRLLREVGKNIEDALRVF